MGNRKIADIAEIADIARHRRDQGVDLEPDFLFHLPNVRG